MLKLTIPVLSSKNPLPEPTKPDHDKENTQEIDQEADQPKEHTSITPSRNSQPEQQKNTPETEKKTELNLSSSNM